MAIKVAKKARRKATRNDREHRLKRGLKCIEVQVPATEVAVIRKVAAILREQPEAATLLRRHLGFAPRRAQQNALDVFVMTEPLSPEVEALWDIAMAQIERERRDPKLNRARDIDL
jgi:hypothetical protein